MTINSTQELIGNTPMVAISGSFLPKDSVIYAKLEMLNPSGSIDDRHGKKLIQWALAKNEITEKTTIIEPVGVGDTLSMAMAALEYNLSVIFIVTTEFNDGRNQLISGLDARAVVLPPESDISAVSEKAEELHHQIADSYISHELKNNWNVSISHEVLASEILGNLPEFDSFVVSFGAVDSLGDMTSYLRDRLPNLRCVVVDEGILNGEAGFSHRRNLNVETGYSSAHELEIDQIYTISDDDAFAHSRWIAKQFGIGVGSSSGAALAGAIKDAYFLGEGSQVVTIFPDSDELYLGKQLQLAQKM